MDDAGVRITLPPLRRGAAWCAVLDAQVLALHADDGRLVMMLPREEAVRHLRIRRDLFYGRTVGFAAAEGLRAHEFRCTPAALEALLAWLPRRSAESRARQARAYAAGYTLIGAALLLFQDAANWRYGVCLVALGIAGSLVEAARWHLIAAIAGAALGALLLAAPFAWLWPFGEPGTAYAAGQPLGALLLLLAAQHASLRGPAALLADARAARRSPSAGAPRSRLCMAAAAAAAAAGLLLGCAALAAGRAALAIGAHTVPVALAAGLLGLLLLAIAAVIALLRPAPYAEARAGAQAAIVAAALVTWGLLKAAFGGAEIAGFRFEPELTGNQLLLWMPLILVLFAFDRAFAAAAEREAARHDAERDA